MSVTLSDVAKFAGVSVGTASQALNHRPGVALATRERVLLAAAELGYPVRPATSIPHALSTVGLLVKHDIEAAHSVNPFYSYVQAGVESECRKHGLTLMYSNVEVDQKNRPVRWPALLNEHRLDGLILVGTFIEDTIDMIKRRADSPVVLLDGYASDNVYDTVVTDNLCGASTAMQYLIDQGHRQIGLIGSVEDAYPSIAARRQGYLDALAANRIDEVLIEDSPLDRPAVYNATQRLLARAPHITAIFACNDEAAISVIKAAHDRGLAVPDDLSVMGFDDIGIAKDFSPALTTIHVYKEWMGKLGIRRLEERVQNPDMPRTTTLLPTQIIIRGSVQCRAVQ